MFYGKSVEVLYSTGWPVTLFLTALLGLLILRFLLARRKNLPPGPTGLPIVGYFPFMTRTPYKKLGELTKKYGDIMSLNVVGKTVIHLGSYDAIKEAYVTHGNEFAGRPDGFSFFRWIANYQGIPQSEGEEWKEHRRFALHTLRDFGFGKLSLEARVQEIAEDIGMALKEAKGKPQNVMELMANSTANVICSLLFDNRYKTDDHVFQKIRHNIKTLFSTLPGADVFISGPMIRYLPLKMVPGGKTLIEIKKSFFEIISTLIKEHQDTFEETFLRDYVDAYLDEMKKIEASGTTGSSTFTIDRLNAVVLSLFVAGTETTSNTLYWALRLLILHPEVQKKIHSEIDQVVGKERLPSILDRQNMPYTEATIHEVLRLSSIASFAPLHSNPEEVTLRNFTIPKRSIIIANLWLIHRDPKYWPEPEKFDPTRFLGADGKVEKRDSFLPFSTGKRVCLGESLARMEIFLFLTSILQRFTIAAPEGETDESLPVYSSLLRTLRPYNLCAKAR